MVLSLYPNPTADVMYNYQYVITMGYGAMFIPVAVVLPICFYLRNAGTDCFRSFVLIRIKTSHYIGSTILSAIISGMVVTLAAFLLFTLTCFLYSPEGTPYIGLGLYDVESDFDIFYARFFEQPVKLYLLLGMIFVFNGAMWPVISLLCFSYTTNQYVVVAVPFLFKTVVGYIAGMLNLYYLDPGQLKLFGSVSAKLIGGGIPYALGYIGIFILLCGSVWACRTYREVCHG